MGDAHIFVYHRFDDARYPTTNTSLKELEREFSYLKKHDFHVIPLAKLVQALKRKEPIESKWVVLTIDDGFKSFLKALPLFVKYHYPFTLFIATKPIQRHYSDFLSWKEIERISSYGEIAFHSHAHPHLVDLSDEEIREDTKKGLDLFTKHLHYKPRFYAYPYGEYDARVKKIIKSFGFLGICNQNIGAIGPRSDPWDLNRIALVGKVSFAPKLSIQFLQAQWIFPKEYPHDGVLKRIVVKIPKKYSQAKLYISGYGWRDVKVKDGLVDENLSLPLHGRRIRLVVKVKHSKMNTKILVRSRYGVE